MEETPQLSFLDKYSEKLISRKFLSWIVATGLLFAGVIQADTWMSVTTIYIGSQAVIDTIEKIKGK